MASKTTLISSCFALITFTTLISLHANTCVALRTTPQTTTITPKPKPTTTTTTTSVDFIKKSCMNTDYPSLCYNSLSSYASTIQRSPTQLADAALTVSLNNAKATSGLMTKLFKSGGKNSNEAKSLSDCMDSMADSVDELQQSLHTMGELNKSNKDFKYKVNDMQTWVSSALTDENTCMEGMSPLTLNEGEATAVRSQIAKVAKLTSNALALINGLANL